MRLPSVCGLTLVLLLGGCQSTGPWGSVWQVDTPALQTDPVSLGEEHFRRGDYGLAEKHYREAAEANPNDLRAWIGLAASYDQLKRFDLADRAYAQIGTLGGLSAQVLNNWGYSHLLRGDYSRASVLLNEAKALDRSDPVIDNNLRLLRGGTPQ